MNDYKEMYSTLFNAITDAIKLFQKCRPMEAVEALKAAQQKTEEMCMENGK